MGKRGAEALLCVSSTGEEKIFRRNRGLISDWNKPVWVGNIMTDELSEFEEILDVNEVLTSMEKQGKVVCVPVRWIGANNNIIEIDKIYSEYNNLKVAFLKNRNALRLIEVPAKTKSEIMAVGQDFDGKYKFPLLVDATEKGYVQINLF